MIRQRSVRFAGLACAVFCLSMLAALIGAVWSGISAAIDEVVRAGIHEASSDILTILVRRLTQLGSIPVLASFTAIALAVCCVVGRRQAAVTLAVVMAGAVLLENGLKFALQRPRPEAFFGPAPGTFSFPSGHALFALCFYGSLAALAAATMHSLAARAAIWTATACLILAIGLSRIYLGVHYPTDVVGGYLVAAAWMSCCWSFRRAGATGLS